MKSWLKAGLIGALIGLIIQILNVIEDWSVQGFQLSRSGYFFIAFFIVIFFLIGVFVSFLIKKVKSSEKWSEFFRINKSKCGEIMNKRRIFSIVSFAVPFLISSIIAYVASRGLPELTAFLVIFIVIPLGILLYRLITNESFYLKYQRTFLTMSIMTLLITALYIVSVIPSGADPMVGMILFFMGLRPWLVITIILLVTSLIVDKRNRK